LLPKNVPYINAEQDGFSIWQTSSQRGDLFLVVGLDIPNGKAFVPPLLWKASRQVILSTIREIKQPNSNLYRTVSNLQMVTDEFR
jgi:hypothetical protein